MIVCDRCQRPADARWIDFRGMKRDGLFVHWCDACVQEFLRLVDRFREPLPKEGPKK